MAKTKPLAKPVRRSTEKHPEPFLDVLVHELDPTPGVTALCAGFERDEWRSEQLADHVLEWLPEFALSRSELKGIGGHNAMALLRKAARAVYTSEKYENRGEFGEILLHIAIRQVFQSVPAISKIFFEDSANHTVKGFDAVHVVASDDRLELWLGEAKFYDDINRAIRDVTEELQRHTGTKYLRDEFMFISNKLDPHWEHSRALKSLLHPNVSLDTVFDCACIPVLLTYDSKTVAGHKRRSDAYVAAIKAEVVKHHQKFLEGSLPTCVRIHLFLLPLHQKKKLVEALHARLMQWQTPKK